MTAIQVDGKFGSVIRDSRGFTLIYSSISAGPFRTMKPVREVFSAIIQAEELYYGRCQSATVGIEPYFQVYSTFRKSPEYRELAERYGASLSIG